MGVGARLLAAFDLPASTAAATPLAEMALAEAGVKHNAEWTPYFKGVDGVRMALVPRGCFTMGSDVERDELPTTYNCFDRPFWIDVAEVTNGQFNRLGGTASRANNWTNDDYPRVNVDWREASDFCRLRGARLPSEAEWEYAARGPDSLVYPWGKDFVEDNVVSTHNSFGHPWPPGSRLGGVSWVGAEDLSGNVWEWTSSWRAPYPYVASDGRESEKNLGGYKARVTRGGSCSYSNAANLRAAYRGSSGPGLVSIYGGFRCVSSY
jgi:iron(II)-dependent oxidoreductase